LLIPFFFLEQGFLLIHIRYIPIKNSSVSGSRGLERVSSEEAQQADLLEQELSISKNIGSRTRTKLKSLWLVVYLSIKEIKALKR
jgi:hypothetical protein